MIIPNNLSICLEHYLDTEYIITYICSYLVNLMHLFLDRFLWLFPLQPMEADEVAHHLKGLFLQFGFPKVLLTDNGSEFKAAVQILCKSIGTRMKHGRVCHPQTTGKVCVRSI